MITLIIYLDLQKFVLIGVEVLFVDGGKVKRSVGLFMYICIYIYIYIKVKNFSVYKPGVRAFKLRKKQK